MTTAVTTQVVNLTPHPINVITDAGVHTFSPSGTVARCSSQSVQVGNLNGIPLFSTSFGGVQDLPVPQDGVMFIVSALVRQAVPNRKDLASPGDLVRDDNGNPVGCRGLNVN